LKEPLAIGKAGFGYKGFSFGLLFEAPTKDRALNATNRDVF
jgi:hypothetical protein